MRFQFVPRSRAAIQHPKELQLLRDFIANTERLLVVTGAGVSTESGVPDYRSPGVGLYARTNHRPVQHQEFVNSAKRRQQYWARNFVGYPIFSSVKPNATHLILSKWEKENIVSALITQNVDSLHSKAGSQNLIELHGTNRNVVCLDCEHKMTRDEMQFLLKRSNLHFNAEAIEMAPDGDVQLTQDQVGSFRVPTCPSCRTGILKPDIVFFGGNVPQARKIRVKELVEESSAVLYLGTSLQVYSSYSIALRAKDLGLPMAVINIGATRADKFMSVKLECVSGDALSNLDRLLQS